MEDFEHPVYGKFSSGFRDICGYEGLYEINEFCIVRNRTTQNNLKTNIQQRVNLHKNGSIKNHQVHRLGLYSFFPNDKQPTVDHIDGNHLNHFIANLEWVTLSENARRYNIGRPYTTTVRCKKIWLLDSRRGERKKLFDSISKAAKQLGLNVQNVGRSAKNNGGIACSGFYFQYDDIFDIKDEKWTTSEALQKCTNVLHIFVSDKGRINVNGYKKRGSIIKRRPKYREIKVNKSKFYTHQLIYAGFNNEIPPKKNERDVNGNTLVIAHNDEAPLDDKGCYRNFPEDLRLSTQSENLLEHHAKKRNSCMA